MVKKTSLASALQEASGKATPVPQESSVSVEGKPSNNAVLPPSRQGKKAITGYFDPAVSRQLRQLALDRDSTIQALLSEALNELFIKYGKNPIA
ncbi:MAG: ribbon-helix-helix domain-containing protein [Snowella sp.]|nr:ribbon-helix-helix domain-containing protein [Snowella sp.]